jgi:hypothetical protein
MATSWRDSWKTKPRKIPNGYRKWSSSNELMNFPIFAKQRYSTEL